MPRIVFWTPNWLVSWLVHWGSRTRFLALFHRQSSQEKIIPICILFFSDRELLNFEQSVSSDDDQETKQVNTNIHADSDNPLDDDAMLTLLDHRKAKALSKAPYIDHMDEPDEQSMKELRMMYNMGLPTCFLNSPRSLDSDEEVSINRVLNMFKLGVVRLSCLFIASHQVFSVWNTVSYATTRIFTRSAHKIKQDHL